MIKRQEYVEGEFFISDDDGFIFQLTNGVVWLRADNERVAMRSENDGVPISEAISEFNLRRFNRNELERDDEFTYNHSRWKVVAKDGKKYATQIGATVRSTAEWGIHHFAAHQIVVEAIVLNFARVSKAEVVEIPVNHVPKEIEASDMSLVDRLDALAEKLDQQARLHDEISADVAMIKELCGVKD